MISDDFIFGFLIANRKCKEQMTHELCCFLEIPFFWNFTGVQGTRRLKIDWRRSFSGNPCSKESFSTNRWQGDRAAFVKVTLIRQIKLFSSLPVLLEFLASLLHKWVKKKKTWTCFRLPLTWCVLSYLPARFYSNSPVSVWPLGGSHTPCDLWKNILWLKFSEGMMGSISFCQTLLPDGFI